MDPEAKRGLMRALGPDLLGGPVDTAAMALKGMPRNLLPPTPVAQLIARALGLPMGTVLPAEPVEDPRLVGTSEWIAEKGNLRGDSPRYVAGRVMGNLGLMALPTVAQKIANFRPRQGDLRMWIGPSADDYDTTVAEKVKRAYNRYMRASNSKLERNFNPAGTLPKTPMITGDEVDRFNKQAFNKYQAVVEPASQKVLQFRPDTVHQADGPAYVELKMGYPQRLGYLYPDPNLQRYPGLSKTTVELTTDPQSEGAFIEFTKKTPLKATPHKKGYIELSTDNIGASVGHDNELAKAKAASVIRHEIQHSLQASDKLPKGGSPESVKRIADWMQKEAELLESQRAVGHAPRPKDTRELLKEIGLAQTAKRGYENPDATYRALVGERIATSAEVHNQPLDMVREFGIPKFSNSIVIEDGQLVPISHYVRGLRPPYGLDPAAITQPGPTATGLLSPALAEVLKRPR